MGFTTRIKEWFSTLKSMDPSLAILPWFKSSKLNPILSPSNIPTEMKVLRNYFQRLSPKSGIIWTKVHLMLDQPPKDITSGPTTQMGWWYKENDEGLYLCPLQDAETTNIGLHKQFYKCRPHNSIDQLLPQGTGRDANSLLLAANSALSSP